MANKIIPKRSSVVAKVPLAGDLEVGEIAVNLADALIFTKNAAGVVITLGGSSGGSGLPTQTGNSGGFLTTDGTTASWAALSSTNITTALGFTPYNATNPAGYITASSTLTGSVNTTGTVAATGGLIGRVYGAAAGAADGWIWSVSPANPTWGMYYNEGTPDAIEFRAADVVKASIFLDTGVISGANFLVTNTNGITLSDNVVGGSMSYGYSATRTNAANHIWYNGLTTEVFRVTSVGHVGFGVVPSAWGGIATNVLEFKGGGHMFGVASDNYFSIGSNCYYDGSVWRAKVSGKLSTMYHQDTGRHDWFSTSTNGTAGATVSFLQTMTLAANGNLTVTGSVTGTSFVGNASTATTLATGRTIALTGDVTYTSGTFNGSANVTGTATLAASGVTAGTYTNASVTVDAKGRVTGASSGATPLVDGGSQTFSGVKSFSSQTNVYRLTVTNAAANEGGEIEMAKPVSGTTLAGNVIIDIVDNSIRFFENGSTFRGAKLDITTTAAGVASTILHTGNVRTVNGVSIFGSGDITAGGGGGGVGVTTSDTAPVGPLDNALWWDSTVGQLRIYYNDGDTAQWVDAFNGQGIPGTNGTDGTDGTNGVGVPAGGTTGQILSKASATDYATAWSSLTGAAFGSQTANLVLAAPNGTAGNPTFRNLTLEDVPDAWVKKAVKAATTANIALTGVQTIDGLSIVAGDRVLVKNQTTSSQNGIYICQVSTWTRALDADTASELAGAMVAVDQGTVNGGRTYDCDFKSTDTVGTTAMTWHRMLDDSVAALYYRKNTATTLTSSTTAQSWLGLSSGVAVTANTIYEFEGSFRLTTTGTTSHTESILFGLSSATVTNMDYSVLRRPNSTTATAGQTVRGTAATAVTVTTSISTAQDVTYTIKGTVAIGTGGNFNPQIQFSSSPGGTSTVILGAMFKMTPIGTTGSNAVNGTWA